MNWKYFLFFNLLKEFVYEMNCFLESWNIFLEFCSSKFCKVFSFKSLLHLQLCSPLHYEYFFFSSFLSLLPQVSINFISFLPPDRQLLVLLIISSLFFLIVALIILICFLSLYSVIFLTSWVHSFFFNFQTFFIFNISIQDDKFSLNYRCCLFLKS